MTYDKIPQDVKMEIERRDNIIAENPFKKSTNLFPEEIKRKKMKRARNYCFTSFNMDINFEKIYEEYSDLIRYMCIGKETCPKTEKKHFQGWVQLYNPKSLLKTKKIFGCHKTHFEACRGNEFQNDKYCKKSKDFKQYGTFITQGHRTDLEKIKQSIDQNKDDKYLWDNHFETMTRYFRSFTKYREINLKKCTKKFRKVETSIYYGKTGTGKTRQAYAETQFKITGSSLQWWDGYEGEEAILIDEYNNDVPITQLLNLLDGYQLRLPIKGGFTYANWTKVIITTNLSKEELHPHAKDEHRKALDRRINKYVKFTKSL